MTEEEKEIVSLVESIDPSLFNRIYPTKEAIPFANAAYPQFMAQLGFEPGLEGNVVSVVIGRPKAVSPDSFGYLVMVMGTKIRIFTRTLEIYDTLVQIAMQKEMNETKEVIGQLKAILKK